MQRLCDKMQLLFLLLMYYMQSVVDLSFQHNLPPFLPVSGHCMQFLFLVIFRLYSTSSDHLIHVLSLFLFSLFTIFVVIFSSFIISVCPYHLYLSDFINFTVSVLCNIYCVSLFVLIFHLYYSFSGHLIFLTIFLSNSVRAMN